MLHRNTPRREELRGPGDGEDRVHRLVAGGKSGVVLCKHPPRTSLSDRPQSR